MVIQLPQPKNLSRTRYLQLANANARALGIKLDPKLETELRAAAMKSIRARASKLKW